MTERKYLVLISAHIPLGPKRIMLLHDYFGSYESIWKSRAYSLLKVGLSKKLVDGFMNHRKYTNENTFFEKLKRLNIKYICFNEKRYPKSLLDIPSYPLVLYVKGTIKKEDSNSIAIVGSRNMSFYGREVSTTFSRDLALKGITIVSGLAKGIDTKAHEGALEVGGRTLAVLGCGLDIVYPKENEELSRKITRSGALISEYPPGYPPLPRNFPARNRIISGLSKGVLVVEGRQRSGTLITAKHAANHGKTVFAIPGNITSPMSEAPHWLIQNGCTLVTSASDIIEEL